MNSLPVVVKSNLFPQFALAEITGGGGEEVGAQSIGSEVAAAVILTTLTVTHNRYLVEAPGKGWAHGVRGIR